MNSANTQEFRIEKSQLKLFSAWFWRQLPIAIFFLLAIAFFFGDLLELSSVDLFGYQISKAYFYILICGIGLQIFSLYKYQTKNKSYRLFLNE
ncbi:MAG: hypothetical protein ACEPOW_12680 [Bacteroidales bacterium]